MYKLVITIDYTDENVSQIEVRFDNFTKAVGTAKIFIEQGFETIISKED